MNQLTIMGNIGRVNTREFENSAVVNFSVAVDNGPDGGGGRKTLWYECAIWDNSPERKRYNYLKERLEQRGLVLVTGALDDPRTWVDKQGETRVSLQVKAFNVEHIGKRASGGAETPAPAKRQTAAKPAQVEASGDEWEADDISWGDL